jgi:hypothetical protein
VCGSIFDLLESHIAVLMGVPVCLKIKNKSLKITNDARETGQYHIHGIEPQPTLKYGRDHFPCTTTLDSSQSRTKLCIQQSTALYLQVVLVNYLC